MMKHLADHKNVTEAAIRYKTSRKTVTKLRNRWNGTASSLEDESRRPKHSPRKHSETEIREIRRRLKKHRWTDLLLVYQELREHGYTRSCGGFMRIVANALLVVKRTQKTLFEEALLEMGIEYKRIRITTPRHNGKVERQHRTDEERFYSRMRMYNLADGGRQLAAYQRKSNDYIMTCLGMRSTNQMLEDSTLRRRWLAELPGKDCRSAYPLADHAGSLASLCSYAYDRLGKMAHVMHPHSQVVRCYLLCICSDIIGDPLVTGPLTGLRKVKLG